MNILSGSQGTFPMGTTGNSAFPYLFWPPERRSHYYFEGNVEILCVRREVQVTTVYPTIPTLSQDVFKLKLLQH